MLSNDANILKIKHEILYQVAKLAYAGQLEEKKEELPYASGTSGEVQMLRIQRA